MKLEDLKRRKNNLGMSVADLAILADVPVGTVSKIMTGETKNPSYLTVEILDAALAGKEMTARIEAFRKAIGEYIKDHPNEDFYYDEFEKAYREKHRLNRKPIPWATPDGDEYWISDNLATVKRSDHRRSENHVTYAEFSNMEDNQMMELLDGQIIINESPGTQHQLLLLDLATSIKEYISKNKGLCKVLIDTDTLFYEDDETCLKPDIAIVCDPENIKENHILTPDMVIEVTSPSTRTRDLKEKRNKYSLSAVREYWIVDLQKNVVIVYTTQGRITEMYSFDDEIPVFIYDDKLKLRINDYL